MKTNPSIPITADHTIRDPRQRRTILIGVCTALMAVVTSVSGLNVAQPQLAHALGASQSDVLWIINIYTITLAALLLPLGAVGDRWGRKPVLITGLIVFGVGSAYSGQSCHHSGPWLPPDSSEQTAGRTIAGWQPWFKTPELEMPF